MFIRTHIAAAQPFRLTRSGGRLVRRVAALSLAACLGGYLLPTATPAVAARAPRQSAAPAVASVTTSSRPSPLAAARRANAALNRHFGTRHGLFNKHPDRQGYAGVWAAAQAIEGNLALARLPGGSVSKARIKALFRSLRFYWDGNATPRGYDSGVRPPLGPGGHKFYDDNNWVGLAMVQAFDLIHDPSLLGRAEQIFELEKYGWDTNTGHPYPGGVFWTQSPKNNDRNTVSTAGAAQLGLQLYIRTGQMDDLSWAITMHDWVNRNLRAPDGLYWDHISLVGGINKAKWSYNQGLMLGLSALLYRATGDVAHLQEAQRIADVALARYDGGNRIAGQPPIFNGIFFKNLLALHSIAPDPDYREAARAYSRYLGRHVERRSGLLRPGHHTALLDQAALVQVNAYTAWLGRGIPVRSW
jgi:hypothetical protein